MRKIIGAALVAAATGLSIAAAVPANAEQTAAESQVNVTFTEGIKTMPDGTTRWVVRAKFVNTYPYHLEALRYWRGSLRSGVTGFYHYADPGTTRDIWTFRCGVADGRISYVLGGAEIAAFRAHPSKC